MRHIELSLLALAAASAACASGGSTMTGGAPTTQTVTLSGGGGGTAALTMRQEADVHLTPYSMPIARVWSVLPAVFDSLGIPPTTIDPASHTIGNTTFKVHGRLKGVSLSRYIDCGSSTQIGPNADSYDVVLAVTAQLRPDGAEMTDLALAVDAVGRPATFAQDYSHCTSKGTLESRFGELVSKQLKH